MTNLAHLAKIRPDADLLPVGQFVYLPKAFFIELERFLFDVHGDWVARNQRAPRNQPVPIPEAHELGALLTCLQNHGRNSGVY